LGGFTGMLLQVELKKSFPLRSLPMPTAHLTQREPLQFSGLGLGSCATNSIARDICMARSRADVILQRRRQRIVAVTPAPAPHRP